MPDNPHTDAFAMMFFRDNTKRSRLRNWLGIKLINWGVRAWGAGMIFSSYGAKNYGFEHCIGKFDRKTGEFGKPFTTITLYGTSTLTEIWDKGLMLLSDPQEGECGLIHHKRRSEPCVALELAGEPTDA